METALDVRLRAVLVLLEPALTLACILGVPMADVVHLAKHVYVHVGKRRGLSVRGMARRFDVVPATIQAFASEAREGKLPAALGASVTRRRSVVAELTDRGACTLAALAAAQPAERRDEVEEAVLRLVEAGIVGRDGEHFRLAQQCLSVSTTDVESRLDALRLYLEATTQLVYRRFFTTPRSLPGESFARVLRFGARSPRIAELRARLFDAVCADVLAADADLPDGAAEKVPASVLFAVTEEPRDAFFRNDRMGSVPEEPLT